MHQHLKLLIEVLENIDNSPQHSLHYFTGSTYKNDLLDPQHHPASDCRWILLREVLHSIDHYIKGHTVNNHIGKDCQDIDKYIDSILDRVDLYYSTHQHLCWPSHQHHFHTNLKSYVNCPISCITEIQEFIDKMIKEIYHT